MTIQRTDALVKDELDRLTANFFRAVTFDEGDAPPYDSIYALFIESGLLIKNTGATASRMTSATASIELMQRPSRVGVGASMPALLLFAKRAQHNAPDL